METIQLAGKYLRQALEYSVTSYDTIDPSGKFLQVSGTCLFFHLNISFDILSNIIFVHVIINFPHNFCIGIRVKFNLQKPEGQRIVDVKVICSECEVPEFKPLENERLYDIVLSNFLLNGGDGYTMIRDNAKQKHVVGE